MFLSFKNIRTLKKKSFAVKIPTIKNMDIKRVIGRALKYLIEGMAVAIAAYYIPQRKIDIQEIITIAIAAAAVFAVLDVLSPSIGDSARTGMGLGVGFMTVM